MGLGRCVSTESGISTQGRVHLAASGSAQVELQLSQRVVKKGPHDCYCEVGYNCWSMAGKARTANFGLMGVFEREFWSNTPGELVTNPHAWNAAANYLYIEHPIGVGYSYSDNKTEYGLLSDAQAADDLYATYTGPREEVKGETSGDYGKMVYLALAPKDVFFADIIDQATRGMGCSETTLIELFLTTKNDDIAAGKAGIPSGVVGLQGAIDALTLADLLVYTLGLTSCFALVAVMHLAGNGLVFERGFRDAFACNCSGWLLCAFLAFIAYSTESNVKSRPARASLGSSMGTSVTDGYSSNEDVTPRDSHGESTGLRRQRYRETRAFSRH